MNPMLRLAPFLLVGAISLPAAAQSCYVHSETSGAVPAPVVTEQCFEFHGVDKDDAINWVCQDNEAVRTPAARSVTAVRTGTSASVPRR